MQLLSLLLNRRIGRLGELGSQLGMSEAALAVGRMIDVLAKEFEGTNVADKCIIEEFARINLLNQSDKDTYQKYLGRLDKRSSARDKLTKIHERAITLTVNISIFILRL